MSILINMDMPTACAYCELIDSLEICPCYKMTRDEFWANKTLQCQRHSDCPLIEVPDDVQPVKHGEWKRIPEYTGSPWGYFECTNCGERSYTLSENYCPNCGARMDGET